MASEEVAVDKENDEVMDNEEGKDTADEAHKELFSLESILIVHVVAKHVCLLLLRVLLP